MSLLRHKLADYQFEPKNSRERVVFGLLKGDKANQ